MSYFERGLSALFASTSPANTSAFEGVERERICKPPASYPAQLSSWGKGRINDAAWSPNGYQMAVAISTAFTQVSHKIIS